MSGPAAKLVYLVEADAALREDVGRQLGHFGYEVAGYETVTLARDAVRAREPDALIVSMVYPEGDSAMVISEILHMTSRMLPVLFLSDTNHIAARLRAIRFGGTAYFTKPPDINQLVAALDRMTGSAEEPAYRVLVVESDPGLREQYEGILHGVGMSTSAQPNPMHVQASLEEFDPELILMNLYYDECLGMELAQVIRQQEAYLSIPIVFISRDTNRERQLAAMGRGGDDVLVHPIQPQHLISSVTARVIRSRILRDLMIRDSLTGLLNHTSLRQKLEHEVHRAERTGRGFCYAMVDIDKFKRVNDSYGHPAGDQVIKNLARTLKQRVRRTDLVGRNGGEEFGIIMPDTDRDTAARVLLQIRSAFSRIRQRYDEHEFFCTYSTGMAVYPGLSDAKSLADAADAALYAAKKAGGNRVGIWSPRGD